MKDIYWLVKDEQAAGRLQTQAEEDEFIKAEQQRRAAEISRMVAEQDKPSVRDRKLAERAAAEAEAAKG